MDRRDQATVAAVAIGAVVLAVKYATDPLGSNFEWWMGVADTVFDGGAPYVDAPDNKPPLWLAVVTAADATGYPAVVLPALTAIGGAVAVALVAHITRRRHGRGAALMAVCVAAVLLWVVSHPANNKPVALAAAVAAVAVRDERHAGVLAGVAGTVAQQFGFILLAVGLVRCVGGRWSYSQGLRAAFGVAAVVGGQYLAVGAIYGADALVAAVSQSVLAATGYAAGTTAMPDAGVLGNQGLAAVAVRRASFVVATLPAFALAALGASADREYFAWALACVPVLAITVFTAYWVFAIPAVAVLAGAGTALIGRTVTGLSRRDIRHT
jgi:hypothetical protein